MKVLTKIICFVIGSLVALKLTQLLIDRLYEKYGKRYIVSTEE